MQTYNVTLTGKTPMLHHSDNIEWADEMAAWKDKAENKKDSKAGDDRSPAWRWIGALYHDGKVVAVPGDNLMRAFMEGGAMVPIPGGKNGVTFKSLTQSGMVVGEPFWPLAIKGKAISVAPILALHGVKDFEKHRSTVAKHGFELHLKRAKVGSSKHIRVRPLFENWSLTGTIHVMEDRITRDALLNILTYAGTYKGLGDWRPSAKTPGPYGTFTAAID